MKAALLSEPLTTGLLLTARLSEGGEVNKDFEAIASTLLETTSPVDSSLCEILRRQKGISTDHCFVHGIRVRQRKNQEDLPVDIQIQSHLVRR